MTGVVDQDQETSSLRIWGIVLAATWVLAIAAGGRFLIGAVFDQVREEFQIDRGTLGLVVSMNVLIVGVAQPAVGWLVDRIPARLVAAAGLGLLGLGLGLTGFATSIPMLVVAYGLVVALGLAASSPVTITPLVAGWFTRKRGTAMSLLNAGGSIGQLAIVPGLIVLVGSIGWRHSYLVVGGALVAIGMPLLLLLLRERESATDTDEATIGCSLRTAVSERTFWQLAVGFFVCGFTMSWVMTYFVDYSLSHGMERNMAAVDMSIMGGMSILGSLVTGWWLDRQGGSLPLAVVYALRGIGFGMLLLPGGAPMMLAAMAVIGFSWSATIPLTSTLCANIYGRRALGSIFGWMFAIMPVGSAIGAALSGLLYDMTGSYATSILLNLASGLLAAAVVGMVHVFPRYEPYSWSKPATLAAD